MAAPTGAPGSRLKVTGSASGSLALTGKESKVFSLAVLLAMAANSGGLFTSLTTTLKLLVSLKLGEPLSVARTVMRLVVSFCAGVGVQENTPVVGLMAAPSGALGSRVK